MIVRTALIVAVVACAAARAGIAQSHALTPEDSALVGSILLAEEAHDSTRAALATGMRHADARIRTLAWRALARMRDTAFAARDSLPALRPPPVWPEPAWKTRYRALATRREDCTALAVGLRDEAWPVRLRAASFLAAPCAPDDTIVATLRDWIAALPADASRRAAGQVSWHGAAHAIVALARLRPAEARALLPRLATHPQWQVRMYAARAAGIATDTVRLRALARDPDDNVTEAAIDALARLTGHADDAIYLAALAANGAQAVRAAALALQGSPSAAVRDSALRVFETWRARGSESERDARVALLAAAGRSASDDRPPAPRLSLAPHAVALALGAERRLRVVMSPRTGGGEFVVRLRGDVAPLMAGAILELARAGWYDGNVWHRVEHDFVVQGGAPGANEYVGYRHYLRDELGTVPHVRGTVGMSTRGHDTGDAQWFINLKDNLRLARAFTVFAEVVTGMDTVDGIFEGDVIERVEVLP